MNEISNQYEWINNLKQKIDDRFKIDPFVLSQSSSILNLSFLPKSLLNRVPNDMIIEKENDTISNENSTENMTPNNTTAENSSIIPNNISDLSNKLDSYYYCRKFSNIPSKDNINSHNTLLNSLNTSNILNPTYIQSIPSISKAISDLPNSKKLISSSNALQWWGLKDPNNFINLPKNQEEPIKDNKDNKEKNDNIEENKTSKIKNNKIAINKDKTSDKKLEKSFDRSKESYRDRSREKYNGRSRDRYNVTSRDRYSGRSRDRYYGRSRDRYNGRSRDRYKESRRDRSRDRYRERDRSRDKFYDYDRERNKEYKR